MRFPQSLRDTAQTSPGKLDRLPRTPAGYTGLALDGYGLRDQPPARPTKPASYPVPVRQVAVLIHASFRHPLARVPLRFTNPSPPSGWIEDFHSQAIEHAGHTAKLARPAGGVSVDHQRLIVGAGIAIGDAVAQHSEQDPGHLVRGGDQSPLAAAPRCDGPLEAGELALPGFCGGMRGFDEGGAQMPGALSGGTVASFAGGLVVAGRPFLPGARALASTT